jgi:hypothetical protein
MRIDASVMSASLSSGATVSARAIRASQLADAASSKLRAE